MSEADEVGGEGDPGAPDKSTMVLGSPGLSDCGEAGGVNPWWARFLAGSTLARLPDGRALNLYCEGEGSLTVLLEGGLGAGAESWRFVQGAVARSARVCAYDRAGLGRSSPGPSPRDSLSIVQDLEHALAAAGITPPYVLVGHSTGGLHARLFADRNRADVVGMVLVEPTSEHQERRLFEVAPTLRSLEARASKWTRRCSTLAPDSAAFRNCIPRPPADAPPELLDRIAALQLASVRGAGAENLALRASYEQLAATRRDFGDLPLIVLTAGQASHIPGLPDPEIAPTQSAWAEMHRTLAGLSSAGVHAVAAGAGHALHREKPEVVIAAIETVLAAAQAR